MANTVIQLKKSATPGSAPTSLANGEIGINYADGVIYYKASNGTIASISSGTPSFGTINAAGTLLIADAVNDVLDIRSGDNITITGDAINDRLTIAASLTPANNWSNTKLSNGSVTLAGALTTTSQITANGVVAITPVGGQEGGEIQLQSTGANTNWSVDSYQNNFRVFAYSGTSVSNVNFFHAVGGGSIRMGVNRTDPSYTMDVNGTVNASAIYVNGSSIGAGSMDYVYVNTSTTAANNYAGAMANAANGFASATFGTATNTTAAFAKANVAHAAANAALANTSGVYFNGNLFFPSGNVAIGLTTTTYKLEVAGSFAAQTKSFVISHPSKEGMFLRHGSLEGPENGVYVRGKVQGKVIELPDYWVELVDGDTITVQLTAIGHSQNPYVVEVSNNNVFIDTENHTEPYCYFTIYGERKDVEKLVVEY